MNTRIPLIITLPQELAQRVATEAEAFSITPEERALQALDAAIAPAENFAEGKAAEGLAQLAGFLRRVPSVTVLSQSQPAEPEWWVKLQIDIHSPVAWHVVQGLGFVLNYLSIDKPLPTVFRPVSPPPYLNGGPEEFLSWVVEARIPFLNASAIAAYLESRLPQPVEDETQWLEQAVSDDEEDVEE